MSLTFKTQHKQRLTQSTGKCFLLPVVILIEGHEFSGRCQGSVRKVLLSQVIRKLQKKEQKCFLIFHYFIY